ncbi:MAG: hypothetical protein ACKO23_06245 [Gemmataceae bacterium]
MRTALPHVEIVRRVTDPSFDAHVAVLQLCWADHGPMTERLWDLPGGITLHGPPPARFAVHVRRLSQQTYAVRLLWEHASLGWAETTRSELLSSCLAQLMTAMGMDLWGMLEQHVAPSRPRLRAA